jgi:MATE efflux family protein
VNIITPLFSFVMVVAMIVSIGCQTLGSIIIATLRGVVFIGIGMLILPTFLGERGIWLTLVLSEVLTLAVSIFLVRRSVVFNE